MPKKFQIVRVRISHVCAVDPYIRHVIDLAKCIRGGNQYQHWTLLKDLVKSHVGWHVPPDEPPNPLSRRGPVVWWMRSEAAYNVTLDAIGKVLGIDCSHEPKLAQREVEVEEGE